MLRDLTIQNYRCFEDFRIDGLEQVNLFVDNNNSGKTSLLEAIYMLFSSDKERALLEIINNRIDFISSNEDLNYPIDNMFFDYDFELPFPGIAIYNGNNRGVGLQVEGKKVFI